MSVFFFEDTPLVSLGRQDLEKLLSAARDSPLRRSRFCLHQSHDDPVQEMVLCCYSDSSVPIHRHLGKSESFHIITGELVVQFHNDSGHVVQTLHMGEPGSGLPFVYRLSRPWWHSVKVLSEYVVLHEVITGPFVQGELDILTPFETTSGMPKKNNQ